MPDFESPAIEREREAKVAPLTIRELNAMRLLAAMSVERDTMLANLTETQARCTALIEENRALRAEIQDWRERLDAFYFQAIRQGEEF